MMLANKPVSGEAPITPGRYLVDTWIPSLLLSLCWSLLILSLLVSAHFAGPRAAILVVIGVGLGMCWTVLGFDVPRMFRQLVVRQRTRMLRVCLVAVGLFSLVVAPLVAAFKPHLRPSSAPVGLHTLVGGAVSAVAMQVVDTDAAGMVNHAARLSWRSWAALPAFAAGCLLDAYLWQRVTHGPALTLSPPLTLPETLPGGHPYGTLEGGVGGQWLWFAETPQFDRSTAVVLAMVIYSCALLLLCKALECVEARSHAHDTHAHTALPPLPPVESLVDWGEVADTLRELQLAGMAPCLPPLTHSPPQPTVRRRTRLTSVDPLHDARSPGTHKYHTGGAALPLFRLQPRAYSRGAAWRARVPDWLQRGGGQVNTAATGAKGSRSRYAYTSVGCEHTPDGPEQPAEAVPAVRTAVSTPEVSCAVPMVWSPERRHVKRMLTGAAGNGAARGGAVSTMPTRATTASSEEALGGVQEFALQMCPDPEVKGACQQDGSSASVQCVGRVYSSAKSCPAMPSGQSSGKQRRVEFSLGAAAEEPLSLPISNRRNSIDQETSPPAHTPHHPPRVAGTSTGRSGATITPASVVSVERRGDPLADPRPTRFGWSAALGVLMVFLLDVAVLLAAGELWDPSRALTGMAGKAARVMVGLKVSEWPFFMRAENEGPLSRGPLESPPSLVLVGFALGSCLAACLSAALLLPKLSPHMGRFSGAAPRRGPYPLELRSLAGAVLGGFMLGFGSRLGDGCSIGSWIGGSVSMSAHAWVWLLGAILGTPFGVFLRTAIGPLPADDACL